METATRMQPIMSHQQHPQHQQVHFRNDRQEFGSIVSGDSEGNGQGINSSELQRIFSNQGQGNNMNLSYAITSQSLLPNARNQPQMFSNNFSPDFYNNKRVSGDMVSNNPEFSGERWANISPRTTPIEDVQMLRNFQKGGMQNSSPGVYPSNTKRQNVGRMPNFPLLAQQMGMPAGQSIMPSQTSTQIPIQYQGAPMPQNSPNGFFVQQPPRPELSHFRPQLANVGPRMPFSQGFAQQPHQQPLPQKTHPNQQEIQQQNFYFNGPMGPPPIDTGQIGKRSRFMRTAQILQQSGLMDVTLKTAALMRENGAIQRDIDALFMETNHLLEQHFASQGISASQNPHMIAYNDFSPQQQLQHNHQTASFSQLVLDY